ncbi:unannotated protein [freshwater metagenome]|uniref:Unannotated protein n=1 Tax=freshwater metagenome TaxID=449393 RepID=A0A6J6WXM2_9ZZZZ
MRAGPNDYRHTIFLLTQATKEPIDATLSEIDPVKQAPSKIAAAVNLVCNGGLSGTIWAN